MSDFLRSLIPDSNRFEVAFARAAQHNGHGPEPKTALLAAAYQSGFVGAFYDDDEGELPSWAIRAARYMADEFMHDTPGRHKLFSDVEASLAGGDGECHVNCRHALEQWAAGGRKGPEPYSCAQDYGSCVDASCAEMETSLFGWRAAQPNLNETFLHSAAWYKYANRGYCGDGWGGDGIATVARRVGCAFRTNYQLPGGEVDFTDDDANERMVARTWCRSGIPSWMVDHTKTHHAYEDGAITRWTGGHAELKKLFAAGGVLHHSGTRTSGGSRPFTPGRTGPHMQAGVGYDDSDQFRQFCRDVIGVAPRDNDFPVINHQTWGRGWSGECADRYWPSWWGPKPQGAWVWWASDILPMADYAWLPRVKGFPGTGPTPAPQHPTIAGSLYAEQAGQAIAIRGEVALTLDGKTFSYLATPDGAGKYRITPKPIF